jgi:Histidine kinase-, DNA gyrase B-, and HSP90-like ATPase
MAVETRDSTFDLVPTRLAVQAMRDNGYKNSAYAVAELIDNSIQAGATSVELLCRESEEVVTQRLRRRITSIGILDNGSGMDAATLRIALQFGNGTRLDDRSGIGRFGMGLPSASISQCRKVEVWSWRNGVGSALFTEIDLAAVEGGRVTEVPEPVARTVPEYWLEAANLIGPTGTLVVWSHLDRVLWRTAKALFTNSEFLIGRMYRRFLASGAVSIRMASFLESGSGEFAIDRLARANDPGYLLTPSSTPGRFETEPLFQTDGDDWEIKRTIEFMGKQHEVVVRFSYAKSEPRSVQNAGSTDYGRHAEKNIGVSIVRAGRELDLDKGLVISYDPVERWWGVEVEFPPELDELFGVTNNKQSARHFSDIAAEWRRNGGNFSQEEQAEMFEEEDPQLPLIEIVSLIDRRLRNLRKLLTLQTKGTRKRERHDPDSAEAVATENTRARQADGHQGVSDAGEQADPDERKGQLADELESVGFSSSDATSLAARTIDAGLKYTFAEADLEGQAFFTVKPVAGEIVIKVNINHPAYGNLVEVLDQEADENVSPDDLRARLNKASKGLKLLLMAWARFEDEQPTDGRRMQLQDFRTDWGRVAYQFLQDD